MKKECFTHPWFWFFFAPPGSIMAPPNKLFSPILSTCIGTSVLLLLLLLFLLYKYNQVRFPVARQELQGLPSLTGSAGSHRQGPSRGEVPRRSPLTASQLPPGVFCCRARLMHQTQSVYTSPTLVPHSCSPEVNVDIPWSQRCSLCAVS